MQKHSIPITPDFTTGSAFIKGESTMAVVSVGTFDELTAKLEEALGRSDLEVVHVHEMDGPFLLAKLPPGSYAVDATLDGKTLHHKVTVRHGMPTKAVFVWPAGTDKG